MAKKKAITGVIARRHPRYADLCKDWDFWMESYYGGRKYIEKHLVKYFKEGSKEYAERVERAHRENHTRSIVDKVNSYIFKEPAVRAFDNALLEKFFKNIDGKGHDVTQFMKNVSTFASVCGRIYVILDKKPLPEDVATGTQADNLAALPYAYIVLPQQMLDLAFNDDGSVKWALIEEETRDDDDPFEGSGELKTQYRLWLPGEWILFDDGGTEIGRGETGMSVCPVVAVNAEEALDPYAGLSLIADIAPIDKSVCNNWSKLDTIVTEQAFSTLLFPIEGFAFPELAEDEKLREKYFVLAANRILLYSAMAQVEPKYISPDASQALMILQMIGRQVKQLYSHMGLNGESGGEVKPESGISKAYDLDSLNKRLATMADNLEAVERRIAGIFGEWMNLTATATIDYPDEFDIKSLADEIALAQDLSTLQISETFIRMVHKRVAQKALPKAPEGVMNKIMDEIDTTPIPEIEAVKAGVFDFDFAKSMSEGAQQLATSEIKDAETKYQTKRKDMAKKHMG